MSIADKVYNLLPESVFQSLSEKYYRMLRIIHKPMSEADFRTLLTKKMYIRKGTTVFVHSSMDKLNIRFPVYRVLHLLLDAVGSEGTLLFPAWHYIGRAEDYLKNPANVFDVKKSPAVLGLLPELARRHKDAYRSLHPVNSVVAIGKHAKELVSEHHLDIYPQGEKSPFYKMTGLDGKVIGLGEKVVSLSFVHCVEDILNDRFPVQTLSDETYEGTVIDYDKKAITVKTKAAHVGIQNRDIAGFFNKHISGDICVRFKFRGNNFFSCSADKLFNRMKELAFQSKTIYHI